MRFIAHITRNEQDAFRVNIIEINIGRHKVVALLFLNVHLQE